MKMQKEIVPRFFRRGEKEEIAVLAHLREQNLPTTKVKERTGA